MPASASARRAHARTWQGTVGLAGPSVATLPRPGSGGFCFLSSRSQSGRGALPPALAASLPWDLRAAPRPPGPQSPPRPACSPKPVVLSGSPVFVLLHCVVISARSRRNLPGRRGSSEPEKGRPSPPCSPQALPLQRRMGGGGGCGPGCCPSGSRGVLLVHVVTGGSESPLPACGLGRPAGGPERRGPPREGLAGASEGARVFPLQHPRGTAGAQGSAAGRRWRPKAKPHLPEAVPPGVLVPGQVLRLQGLVF